MNEKVVAQYLGAVRKELHCSAEKKCAFLSELKQGLDDFSQETPQVTMNALVEAFGTPETQANEFMNTLDSADIKKAFGWKRAVVAGVLAALLLWAIMITSLWIEGRRGIHGYTITYNTDEIGNTSIISVEVD